MRIDTIIIGFCNSIYRDYIRVRVMVFIHSGPSETDIIYQRDIALQTHESCVE